MEEKWKLSRKESSSSSSSSSKSFFSRTSSSKLPLLRSLSHKHTPSASSAKSPSDLRRSSSQKSPSIGHKCSSLAKEQKARFYIMRRCVAMLVCWHKHGDP
ncbi:uncharacterized protein LOC111794522 [Cucurbita pepo subsp. pepo]|uniref:uncharacterized protein LOC111794522 n=1 Tax=Cucurbita pepo subsp. pepo TaxID=3664 RepID=UPI000C9D4A22|nr:uncharacterized protein LOC111794522 [Cucurbita pepo subsp. pepo]